MRNKIPAAARRGRPLALCAAFLFLIGAVPRAASEQADDFRYSKALEGAKKGLCGFYADLDALRLAAAGLRDLRIVDARGRFVPYFSSEQSTKVVAKSWTLRTFLVERGMRGEEGKERPFASFQVLATKEGGPGPAQTMSANAMEMKFTRDSDFSVEVSVEGRSPSSEWESIGQDSLYSIDGAEKRVFEFPSPGDYAFYRVSILSGSPGVGLASIVPRYDEKIEIKRAFLRSVPVAVSSSAEKEGWSLLKLGLPAGFPLQALVIEAAGRFDRECELRGEEGLALAAGRLDSRIGPQAPQRLDCAFRTSRADELTLAIHDGDDRPLELKAVRAEYRTVLVVFDAEEEGGYSLLFGKDDAAAPAYDIRSFASDLLSAPKTYAGLGPLVDRGPKGGSKAVKPQLKLIFDIAIAATGLALIVLILLLLRRRKA